MATNKFVVKMDRPRRVGNPPAKQLMWLESDIAHAHIADKHHWYVPPVRYLEETPPVFYDELKSIWWMFKLFGLLPLQKPATGKATFRWFSKEMFYAICFFALMSVVVAFEIQEKGKLAIRYIDKFDTLMFAVLMILYIVPHFWMPVRHWKGAAKLASLINEWATFQTEFRQVTRHPLSFGLRRLCPVAIVSLVVICYLFVLAEYYALDETHLHTWEIFYYGYALILINLHVLLWCLLCTVSKRTSKQMMHFMQQESSRSGRFNSSNAVSHYRLLWLHLSKLTRQFGNVYCYQFGHLILFWFTTFLLSVYYLFTLTKRPTIIHLGVAANGLVIFATIMTFCLTAQSATDEVGEAVKEQLQKMSSDDEKTHKQLLLFENTIFQNQPVISLGGYVQVNRQLLVSMFSTTVTYLVVMLQFDQNEQSAAKTTGNGTALH